MKFKILVRLMAALLLINSLIMAGMIFSTGVAQIIEVLVVLLGLGGIGFSVIMVFNILPNTRELK